MAFGVGSGLSNGEPISDINITPLVDVMLVLLIVFMITAPMMVQGVDVNLPRAAMAPLKPSEEMLTVRVTKDGTVWIDKRRTALDELPTVMAKVLEARTIKDVLLTADRELSYETVMRVISRLKKAGVNRIGMVTQPEGV
jgi:biopolymer transport protein TolR